jgi:signal transduction histidine kinase
VEEARSHPRFKSDFLRRQKIRSYAGFPLTHTKGIQGVLALVDTEERGVSERALRWGQSLANSLASFLERIEAEEALRLGEQEALSLAQDLKKANDELEAFAYSVSHDLRAPLRTMQGFAHALLQEHGGSLPPQARDFARRIIESGRQSEGLIRDLLSYSRMSFEELQLQEVELSQVLADAREQVGGYLNEAGAHLEVANDLPAVLAHHTTLVQVMANLLSNAVKFVPEGTQPRVSVGWEEVEDQDRIRLWVQDNGIGIPKDQHERIFKVFERLEGEVDRPGTGIGLAIVRRGMERVGGRAGVDSSEGGGSRFWLDLPKSKATAWLGWRGRGKR